MQHGILMFSAFPLCERMRRGSAPQQGRSVRRFRLSVPLLQDSRPGVHKSSKNLDVTSIFQTPELQHEASSTMEIHKLYAKLQKIQSPRRPGARGLCTPSHGTLPGFSPISYPFDTGYFFSADKANRTVKLTIHLHIILPGSRIQGIWRSPPSAPPRCRSQPQGRFILTHNLTEGARKTMKYSRLFD